MSSLFVQGGRLPVTRHWHHSFPTQKTIHTAFRFVWNGFSPQLFEERIIFMSVVNDLGQTQVVQKLVCTMATEVATFATQFKPGHWCFQGPASEIRGGT